LATFATFSGACISVSQSVSHLLQWNTEKETTTSPNTRSCHKQPPTNHATILWNHKITHTHLFLLHSLWDGGLESALLGSLQ
jgi:hypothetical protein